METLVLISVIAGVISFMADSLIDVPFTPFECLEYFSLVYYTIFSQPYLDMGLFGGYESCSVFLCGAEYELHCSA